MSALGQQVYASWRQSLTPKRAATRRAWRERRRDNAFGPSPRTVAEVDNARAHPFNRRDIPPGPGVRRRKTLPFRHGQPVQIRRV